MYTLRSAPSAQRDIATLKQRAPKDDFERLNKAIRGLAEEPRPQGVMKIKGYDGGYRIRVGNYRVVYRIYDDANKVVISHVLRRNETTYRA